MMAHFLQNKLKSVPVILNIAFLVGVGLFAVAQAAGTVTVSLPANVTAICGGQVTVDVNITGLTADLIDGYQLRIDYDPSVLSNPTAIKTGTLSETVAVDNFIYGTTTDGIGRYAIGVFTGFSGSTDGVLVKIRFDVADGFAGTTAISFTGANSANPKTTLHKSFVSVSANFYNGSLTVGDEAMVITLMADPASIVADGTTTATITSATIKNADGTTVPDGTKVTVATDLGTITTADADAGTPGIQVLTSNGIITFTLRSGLTVGTATVTATAVSGNATGTQTVAFTTPSAIAIDIDETMIPSTLSANSSFYIPDVVSGGTGDGFTYSIVSGPTGGRISSGGYFYSGSNAGVYVIQVQDKTSLATATFTVKVSIKVSPTSGNFLATGGHHYFYVDGFDGICTWEIMDSLTATTPVPDPEAYGTWSVTTTNYDGRFTPNADITAVKTFYARVTVSDDPDLTSENGLNQLTVGPFRIIPTATYTVHVRDTHGTPLSGATVTVSYKDASAVTTGVDGKAAFTLPSLGGKYSYTIAKAGYVSQKVTSADKTLDVTLPPGGASIAGTVWLHYIYGSSGFVVHKLARFRFLDK